MRSRQLLLGSVSVMAVAAASNGAQAENLTVPDGYSVSVEGGFLMGPNTLAHDTADKLGSYPGSAGVIDLQENIGYRAAISLGKQIDPLWDLRVGASLNHQLESTSSFRISGGMSAGTFEIRNDFDFENLDFEVGYTPVLDGSLNVRLFAGIRGLHFNDNQAFAFTEDKVGNYFNEEIRSEFIGAGPRIGVGASTRLGDSDFGISGMVAGAVIHGLQRTNADILVVSGGAVDFQDSTSQEEWKTVLDVEAALGLDYYLADQTKLTLGYRAEQLFDVGVTSFPSGGDNADRLVHGPFVKVESRF